MYRNSGYSHAFAFTRREHRELLAPLKNSRTLATLRPQNLKIRNSSAQTTKENEMAAMASTNAGPFLRINECAIGLLARPFRGSVFDSWLSSCVSECATGLLARPRECATFFLFGPRNCLIPFTKTPVPFRLRVNLKPKALARASV